MVGLPTCWIESSLMRLYLGGHLDFYHPERTRWLDVEILQPNPLSDLLTTLGIPLGEVYLVVVNGQMADLQTVFISALDEVKLFSAVGGG